jgi:hypothetical protein
MREIDQYFLQQPEPAQSCLQALRLIILQHDPNLSEAWKYRMPFYCYNGKMCCYLWVHKKHGVPYLGIVEGAQINHPQLLQEKRARMKIFLIDPAKDIPIKTIKLLLKDIIALYRH